MLEALTPEALDLAVWPIFERMTQRGIRVDAGRLVALRAEVLDELDVQESALNAYAGRKLNPYSPDDVGKWLSDEGLAGRRRTRGGAVSTDERALTQLTDLHPVPGCVLECRGLRKLLTTFIEPVLAKVGGRPAGAECAVHPKWRLAGRYRKDDTRPGGGVKSGRPSMEDPNLLAFPARDEFGKRVRECFEARPGHLLVSVDFSQIEPRIAAALSQDAALMQVFASGADLYADMARRIFKEHHPDAAYKLEPLKTLKRQPAKIILLGCVLYGMQAPLLHDELIKFGCGTPSQPFYSLTACEDFVRRRFEPYPGVAALYNETVRAARAADGWVETKGGRRRFLPALLVEGRRWPAEKLREEAERQAFNHLIQGTAQEVMKQAMVRADESGAMAHNPLLQIYDEMIYEVPAVRAEYEAKALASLMASRMNGVDIAANWSVADSWGGLKG
jgi:DNA polymerase-1